MAGLGEILDENARLRDLLRERDAQIAALAAQLAAQVEAQAAQAAAEVATLHERIEELKVSNELLARKFEWIDKRRQLAAAERMQTAEAQGGLFEGLEVAAPPRDPEREKSEADSPDEPKQDKRKTAAHPRKGRRDVSSVGFPVQPVEAPVSPSACERCGGDRQLIEPRVSHRVGWVPGQFILMEVHQQRCQCPKCPKAEVWTAPEPSLIPGAMCDDSLLARVVVDKFGDHLPLNRQADRMTRQGFPVNENVLSGWVRRGSLLVRLLVKALRQQVAETKTLLGDDSGFPVQDGTDGKLANGRLWVFTDQCQAFYAFSRTKEGEHPKAILQELGVERIRLLVDGGSEYNAAEAELALTRGGCWSHLRRYFFNASLQHDTARDGLATIRDLFLIERELATKSDAERLEVRHRRSKPLVDGFYTWVRDLVPKARPGSKLGEALGYAISQEPRMRLFLEHGDVPMHNNLSELLIRQPIVGRKNWLFSGSTGGAQAAVDWFSLIASCRMQSVDPWQYLHDVFGRLLDYSSKRVHELTPLNWRQAVEEGTIVPRSPRPRP